MDSETDTDIVMGDSIDQSSRNIPPLPPRHAPNGSPRDIMNVNVQVTRLRSSSPEKSVTSQSITTIPASVYPYGEPADSGRSLEAFSHDRHLGYNDARMARKIGEDDLRSRNDDLEARHQNFPYSEAYSTLQSELDAERRLREMAENDLRQKTIDFEDIRKRWKQAARELDKSRSQSQGFYQVTDHYLIQLTTQLRYNIRSFAIQYFGGELHKKLNWNESKFWALYMEKTTQKIVKPESYLKSQVKCPSVIQAFLWRYLASQIFDNFRWADAASRPFWELCEFLRPMWQIDIDSDASRNPETERKFQVWSATTTSLLIESKGIERESKRWKEGVISNIRETIDPYLRSGNSDYAQELLRILDDAIALDKEISRQVARLEWVFPRRDQETIYSSATMEVEKGEKPPKPNQEVLLTVSPGLKKRGRSTGEDFKVENLLVPIEVSCELAAAPSS